MRYFYILCALLLFVSCAKKAVIQENKLTDENVSIVATENKDEERPAEEVDEILKGNDIKESGISEPDTYTGSFEITMSGYKGEIFIGIKDGSFYGTIKFYNWGNGTPQPLKNLRVNEDKIYFVRSITTKEELVKYGGTAFFTQEFYGFISKDKKIIRGYYRYAGMQDNWQAVRK